MFHGPHQQQLRCKIQDDEEAMSAQGLAHDAMVMRRATPAPPAINAHATIERIERGHEPGVLHHVEQHPDHRGDQPEQPASALVEADEDGEPDVEGDGAPFQQRGDLRRERQRHHIPQLHGWLKKIFARGSSSWMWSISGCSNWMLRRSRKRSASMPSMPSGKSTRSLSQRSRETSSFRPPMHFGNPVSALRLRSSRFKCFSLQTKTGKSTSLFCDDRNSCRLVSSPSHSGSTRNLFEPMSNAFRFLNRLISSGSTLSFLPERSSRYTWSGSCIARSMVRNVRAESSAASSNNCACMVHAAAMVARTVSNVRMLQNAPMMSGSFQT